MEDWAGRFGPEQFTPLDNLERKNMVKMDRLRFAMRPMVELYKELASRFANDPELVGRIRDAAFLVVPAGR